VSNLKYLVTIVETLEKEIEIEASSSEEALSEIKEEYLCEDILLSGDDWSGTTIRIFEEGHGALLEIDSI
jgi:hypothetical protein